ncbi:MAG: PQQ-dependent sugar dehydrogenase [Chloroflexi bacterium]|nr:PQQ-dependent sugar dehydrogenase [Chloroflexota bacterium]
MARPPRRTLLLVTLPLAVLLIGMVGWVIVSQQQQPPPPKIGKTDATATAKAILRAEPTATPYPGIADGPNAVTPRSTAVVPNITMPMGMTFAPDGRMFFSEVVEGTVRVAEPTADGYRLLTAPFAKLTIAKGGETGTLGIAVDPAYEQNRWVYLYYSEPDPNRADRRPLRNRIVRFTDVNNIGTDMTVIFDNIGISRQGRHNGGRLLFGPDGKLYVSTGNAEDKENSQSLKNPNGKILRLNRDGTVPADNPFPGSPIYAYGFRNIFGLALHPVTNQFYVTENSGDSHDELNLIQPGANYGFPFFEGYGNDSRYVDPIWESGSRTIGPTGLAIYGGDQLPQLKGDLFYCAFNTGTMVRVRLDGPKLDTVTGTQDVVKDCFLDVVNGPDGALYYSSISAILRLGR